MFQARDVYEEAIQTVMTVRDFGQVNVGLLTETFSMISKASSPLLCCSTTLLLSPLLPYLPCHTIGSHINSVCSRIVLRAQCPQAKT